MRGQDSEDTASRFHFMLDIPDGKGLSYMRYQTHYSSYKNSYKYKDVFQIVEEVFVAHDKAANYEQARLLVLYALEHGVFNGTAKSN